MKVSSTILSLLALSSSVFAALPDVFPKPQQSQLSENYTEVKSVDFIKLDPNKPAENLDFTLPVKEGAYALVITDEKLTVYAYDETGRFYAKQTISQLLQGVPNSTYAQKDPFPDQHFESVARMGKLPKGTIVDWPDMPHRGVVEGYYGTPWTIEDRIRQIEFYGRNKMNTYIWAPKDDPYHHGYQCRDPYPPEVAKQITELCKVAEKNHVKFVWSIHPANTVNWKNDNGIPDMKLLVKKLELMYDLGVRHFGIFVDDSNGEINQAKYQGQLCSYLKENFMDKKPDVGPVIMCPTGYSRAWTPAPWLTELGEYLHPDIRVMWTGDGVAWKILLEGQEWAYKALKRPTFIWWNWPCTDYCRSQLAMGRTYDLSQDPSMKELINGFVSNPMEWPEASKLGVFGVGDYAWNIVNFDSHKNWAEGMKRLFPSNHEAMQIFSNHNSDLGNNGHGFGREESVVLSPLMKGIERALDAGEPLDVTEFAKMLFEYAFMVDASAKLMSDKELTLIQKEIGPWIELFGKTGELGISTMKALATSDYSDRGLWLQKVINTHEAAEALRQGAKKPSVGYQQLTPFTYRLVDELSATLKSQFTGEAKQWARPRFSSSAKVNDNNIRFITDTDEQTTWTQNFPQKPGDWYMLDYGAPQEIYNVLLIMGGNRPEDYVGKGQMEYSLDGQKWEKLGEPTEGARVFIDMKDTPLSARYLRYTTITPKEGNKWLNIATFDINRSNELMGASTDIPAWKSGRVVISKKNNGYGLGRIMEPVSMPAGATISMDFPAVAKPEKLLIDLDIPDTSWGTVTYLGDRTEVTTELKKGDQGPLPLGLHRITLTNASDKPVEIKLKEWELTYPAKPHSDVASLFDGKILTGFVSDSADGSSSVEIADIPAGTRITMIAGEGLRVYSIGDEPLAPTKQSGYLYEYVMPEGGKSLIIDSKNPVYEIYFQEK